MAPWYLVPCKRLVETSLLNMDPGIFHVGPVYNCFQHHRFIVIEVYLFEMNLLSI